MTERRDAIRRKRDRKTYLDVVPDAKDGKPHFMHGMVSEFEVAATVVAQ